MSAQVSTTTAGESSTPGRERLSVAISESIAGLAVSVFTTGLAISIAALIFNGPLAPGLPRASGSFVLGTAVILGLVAWRSGIIPAISSLQDGPAIVMVAVAASLATRTGTTAADVVVLLGLIGLTTGLVSFALGRFRLGIVIRYLPMTVVAAFVAGTGWLLVKGGLDVMVRREVGLDDVSDLFGGDLVRFWLPGLTLGLAMLLLGRSRRVPPIASSALVVVSVGVFYAAVAVSSSLDVAETDGWLIGPFPSDAGPSLIGPDEVVDFDWGGLVANLPGVLTVVGVGVVALLLNVSGLELVSHSSVDVDQELRTAGVANVVASPLGCGVGFHSLGNTTLAINMGVANRRVGVACALLIGLFALVGTEQVGYLPRLVVGGLLTAVGLHLLVDWVVGLAGTAPWNDRLLGVGIVAIIAWHGILTGIAVGVVVACAIFVFQYSRIDPVRLESSGRHVRSRVDRTAEEADVLADASDRLAIYELQGYLFFGSVAGLAKRVRSRCNDTDRLLDAVVLDFRQVTGVDLSGLAVLRQLSSEVMDTGAIFALSGCSPDLSAALHQTGLDSTSVGQPYATLDAALEVVEEHQLEALTSEDSSQGAPSEQRLPFSAALLAEFEHTTAEAGEIVIRQGDSSDVMHIVVDGSLVATRIDMHSSRHRLRRLGPVSLVGEIGFLADVPRTAEVVASTHVQLLTLSRARYQELRASAPDLVIELQDFVLRAQARRAASMSDDLSSSLA